VTFATLGGCGTAMMSAAGIPMNRRKLFWWEASETATFLDSLIMVEVEGKNMSRFKHWYGKASHFPNHVRKWGEIGVLQL
jgi:hypothetical protein